MISPMTSPGRNSLGNCDRFNLAAARSSVGPIHALHVDQAHRIGRSRRRAPMAGEIMHQIRRAPQLSWPSSSRGPGMFLASHRQREMQGVTSLGLPEMRCSSSAPISCANSLASTWPAHPATTCRGAGRLSAESNCAKVSRWLEMAIAPHARHVDFPRELLECLCGRTRPVADILLEPAGFRIAHRHAGAALGNARGPRRPRQSPWSRSSMNRCR